MKLSTTTLGCPDWDLVTILRRVGKYGYDAVDFRGLQEQMDITQLPAFTTEIAKTKSLLKENMLHISCFSSSCRFLLGLKDDAQKHLDEAIRYLEVAHKFNTPFIRIFDGKFAKNRSKRDQIEASLKLYEPALNLAGKYKIILAIETHDGLVHSSDMKQVIEMAANPYFGILWDVNHPYRKAGETVETTIEQIGEYIVYVHIKDVIVDTQRKCRLVLTGKGTNPIKKCIKLLKGVGYDGYLTLEWEKRWHPEIEPPEVAFPHYVRQMKEWLTN